MNIQKLQIEVGKLSDKVYPNKRSPTTSLDDHADDLIELLNNSRLSGYTIQDVFNRASEMFQERRKAVMSNDNVQMEFKV